MSQRPLTVFLSATTEDLKPCRKAAAQVLRKMGIYAKFQEELPADYRPLIEHLREEISKCDAFVCLAGFVFGSAPAGSGGSPRSYTQIEYDVARSLHKPVFAFLTASPFLEEYSQSQPPADRANQEAFRSALQVAHTCEWFGSLAELKLRVAQAAPSIRAAVEGPGQDPGNEGKAAWIRYAAIATVLLAAILSFPFLKGVLVDPPERSFTHSVLLRGAAGDLAALPPDAVIPAGSNIKIDFESPQDGYLYLIAEGPSTASASSWVWLFPQPGYQMGSAHLAANQPGSVPNGEDDHLGLPVKPGREKIHFIWAANPIETVESVKSNLFARNSMDLSASEAATLAVEIGRYSDISQKAVAGAGNRISGRSEVIVGDIGLTLGDQGKAFSEWRASANKSQSADPPAVGAPAKQLGDTFIGLNVWKMELVRGDAPVKTRGLTHKTLDPEGKRDWTPARVALDATIAEGERVRIGVESTRRGYLYVIQRDLFANGQKGKPELIFPTNRLRDGKNLIQPGFPIEIPGFGDDPNVWEMVKTRADQNALELMLIVAPQPLPEVMIQEEAQFLPEKLVADWVSQWSTQVTLSEDRTQIGRVYTLAEKISASISPVPLTERDAIPLSLFHRLGHPEDPMMAIAAIRVVDAR